MLGSSQVNPIEELKAQDVQRKKEIQVSKDKGMVLPHNT